MKRIRFSFVALALAAGCSGTSAEPTADLGAGVTDVMKDGHAPTSVLVYLKSAADLSPSAALPTPEEKGAFVYRALADHADKAQAPLVSWLSGQKASFRPFHIVNAVVVYDASPALVRKLAARPDVARIAVDKPALLKLPTPVDPTEVNPDDVVPFKAGSNIVATGATKVWKDFHTKGDGIVVAGQDTGIDWTHPALKKHYRGWDGTKADHAYNWHDAVHKPAQGGNNSCGYDLTAPCDDHGHGTHTMGTVVGDDGRGNQVGMAPNAKFIGCRNMDAGTGTPSRYIECFEWMLAPYPPGGDPRKDGDPKKAPNVINNSWGCPADEGCTGKEIVPAMTALFEAGIVVVASAGNDGPSCSTIDAQPATDSVHTLSVGAYDHTSGQIASFSSRGPSTLDGALGPDVSAPGVGIRSSVPGGAYQGGWSGTSMAGPHVVGAVALLMAVDPTLKGKPQDVMNVMTETSKAVTTTESCGGVAGTARPNNTFGWGTLDVYAAATSRKKP